MDSTQDDILVNRLKRKLSRLFGRKKLVEYFTHKGIKLDEYIYPPMLQDLPVLIPEFRNKIEITPFSEKIDPTSGVVAVGWNLFVLGVNRSFLGYSYHENAQDLKRSFGTSGNNLPHDPKKKAGDVVDFITDILASNKDGVLDPVMANYQTIRNNVDGYSSQNDIQASAPTMSTGFGYEKTRTVN